MTIAEKQDQIVAILKALNVSEEEITRIMVIVDDIASDEYEKGYEECGIENGL